MRPEAGLSSTQGPVARIRNGAGAICGTGLLIGERHVMTCAHVIDDAVSGRKRGDAKIPEETVTLDLPFLERRGLTARVVAWHPMADDIESTPVSDIAVLELEAPVPGGLDPREAVLSAPPSGTAFTTLGFPGGMDGGAEAQGELRMRDAGGWRHVQDIQDQGYFVEPGFSGAPVFDAEAALHGTRRLLGIVVAVDRDAAKRLAFVIPTPTLGQGWPLLVRPYKGLDAFEAEDADLFFGREEKIAELADKIARRPFLALIGSSGSGKSSLVRAGLVPRLRAEGSWASATFKPRGNPLYGLAEALVSLTAGRVGDGRAKRATALAEHLQAEPRHVLDYAATALDAVPGAGRLLLVVDQFEELFTLAPAPGAIEDPATPHGAFAAVLEVIGNQPADTAPVRVVATLRADFTGQALRHGVFERLMTDADVKLGPLSPADLTDAVAKAAERFDVTFDPGLVPEIVATMRDSRGGLPLMQFALDRLWQVQSGRRLTQASYQAIGKVEGALNDHAEAFRADLGAEDQTALRRVMTRLVNLADPGTGSEDTRAVATRAEIGEDDWNLVGRLAGARLVTTGGAGGKTGSETAEIAHETLIRAWETLRAWLDEDRTFALWRQRLRHDVERWDDGNDDALLRGALLADAERWLAKRPDDLNDEEADFINAGVEKREAEEKVARDRERAEAEKERQQREEHMLMLRQKNDALEEEAEARAKEAVARTMEAEARKRGEEQQKRLVRRLGILAIALVAAFLMAVHLGRSARTAATEALGRQLAAEARVIANEVPGAEAAERAAAMTVEAWNRRPTSQAYQVAARSMLELPIARLEHDGLIGTLAFSPDGTRLATGSNDNTARIFDAATGDEIARIEHEGPVETLAFSRDGTRLATVSRDENYDGTVRILNAETGVEIVRRAYNVRVGALAFSPDGTRLATGGSYTFPGSIVRILDAKTGDEIVSIEHDGLIGTLAYSPDGTRLATGSNDGTARILDAATGDEIARIEHGGWVHTLAYSPDGTRLATGSNDGTARILDAATGEEIARIEHGDAVRTLAYSPDGTRLATGSGSTVVGTPEYGTARILDAATGVEIARVDYGESVRTLAFSRDGRSLAIGIGRTARIIDAETGDEIIRVEHDSRVWALIYSPDGTRLATGSVNGTARIFDIKSSYEMARADHRVPVDTLAFNLDGTRLATGSGNGLARVLDAATGREMTRIEQRDTIVTLAFSHDGTRLATGSDEGTIRIVDLVTGNGMTKIEHGGDGAPLAFSPDGTRLAVGSDTGSVRIHNVATGDAMTQIDPYDWVLPPDISNEMLPLAFSPDGTRLATGIFHGTVRIHDVATGDLIASIYHVGPVRALAFSPDGARLATGSENGTVRISDSSTGGEITHIEHSDGVVSLAFSLDGTRLASVNRDGTTRSFDAATGEEIAYIALGGPILTLAFSHYGTQIAIVRDDSTVQILGVDPEDLFGRLCEERAGRNLTREEWRRYISEDEPWRETCAEWRTVE